MGQRVLVLEDVCGLLSCRGAGVIYSDVQNVLLIIVSLLIQSQPTFITYEL